jgi:four helix bundle protein
MLELNHKKLDVWQKSIRLVTDIYALTEKFPKTEVYGITSQMKRAAISVSSNISEGASRFSKKERKRFYEITRSSLVELDTQLEISINLNFLTEDNEEEISKKINIVFAMLSNLIKNT